MNGKKKFRPSGSDLIAEKKDNHILALIASKTMNKRCNILSEKELIKELWWQMRKGDEHSSSIWQPVESGRFPAKFLVSTPAECQFNCQLFLMIKTCNLLKAYAGTNQGVY